MVLGGLFLAILLLNFAGTEKNQKREDKEMKIGRANERGWKEKRENIWKGIYSITYSYVHTSWSKVLPEKLTDSQLVKKFPAFYGTPRLITAFTRARHVSLS